MSGHSKWSTIKRAKGAADTKRGQTFTKIANAITIASKLGGGGDPESNPRLRMVLEQARGVNMPKENIQRAIDRGLGKLEGQRLEEVVYEGFGPGRVAFIVEAVTDDKNRTTSEVRNLFDRSGGGMGNTGSVSYMFEQMGEIRVKSRGGEKDEEIFELIDLGAEDVEESLEEYLVYTKTADLSTVSKNITQNGYKVEESGLVMKPKIMQSIDNLDIAKKVIDFAQKLEDSDDIQKVYPNFDIPQDILESI
ncbi:MAG: transcriptional regulator [Candidatus Daviesbacteria bacterium GW2011_GWA1_38_7]|nr:MAG: transcriptional regulator [Candidatus Daviesbacteria bacterium GW2011_GWA1_38_7]